MSETNQTTLPVVQLARDNDEFRKVIWTGQQCQLVLMAIAEGDEIGGEVHEGHDQLLYFVEGSGQYRTVGHLAQFQEHRQGHAQTLHDLLAAGA